MKEWFGDIQNVKKLGFEGGWAELGPKICFLRQSWAGYCGGVGRVRRGWAGQGGFDICFGVFLDCYCRGLVSGVGDVRFAVSPPEFSLYFLNDLSLKSFGNSSGNSYTKFAIMIPGFVLLVVNRTSTKTLSSSKIL